MDELTRGASSDSSYIHPICILKGSSDGGARKDSLSYTCEETEEVTKGRRGENVIDHILLLKTNKTRRLKAPTPRPIPFVLDNSRCFSPGLNT